jgi:hypothetical protein
MKLSSMLIVAVVVASMAVSAFAFDGRREGFILGGGFGLGSTSHTEKHEYPGYSYSTNGESKVGFQTNFKIGWGASQQLEIYYTQISSFFSTSSVYIRDVTILDAIGAIGASYSFKPVAPTPFITGGLGMSIWAVPFEDNPPEAWSGFGLYGGVGYEFYKHYSAELDLAYGKPKLSKSYFFGSEEWSTSAFSVRLTINALAY